MISDFASSLSIERPMISRITPPIDKGADIDMANIEPSLRRSPDPNAMQIHAEITTFSRRFETLGRTPMLLGRWGLNISTIEEIRHVQGSCGGWGSHRHASVAQLGRASDL